MTYVEPTEELPPVAGANIVYLGPVAPHWDIRAIFGEQKIIDDFRMRVNARLLLLPKHDPQFRRNRERVNRDAERELIRLEWDLGDEEAPRYAAPNRSVAPAPVQEAPVVEEALVVDEPTEAPLADDAAEAPVVEEAIAEAPADATDEATDEAADETPAESEAPNEA